MTERRSSIYYRLLGSRASAGTSPQSGDDLSNINTTALQDHAMCWAAGTLWQLDKSLSGSTVFLGGEASQVAPVNGPGLWLPVLENQNYGAQAVWYLDPQNPLASDTNDGLTPQTPIATRRELARRLTAPELLTANPLLTVNVVSDVNPGDPFVLTARDGIVPGVYGRFRIKGNPTELFRGTLTGRVVPAPATNVRGSITIAGIDWSTAGPGGTSLVGKRIRRLSDDAIAWAMSQDPGDPTTVFTMRPTQYGGVGFDSNFAVGEEIVVEELTSFGGGLWFEWLAGYGFVQPWLQDIKVGLDPSVDGVYSWGATWIGCEIDVLRANFPFALVSGCKFTGSSGFSTLHATGPGCDLSGCWFDSAGAFYQIAQGFQVSLNHCAVTNARLDVDRSTVNIENGFEMWDWPAGAGLEISESAGGIRRVSGNIWGVSTVANTFAIKVGGYTRLRNGASGCVAVGTLSPGKDVEIGLVSLTYADLVPNGYVHGISAPVEPAPNLAGITN